MSPGRPFRSGRQPVSAIVAESQPVRDLRLDGSCSDSMLTLGGT